jgi:hypothetical protein
LKKKSKNTIETDNWGNFGGADIGIPSYFGEPGPVPKPKKKDSLPKVNLL